MAIELAEQTKVFRVTLCVEVPVDKCTEQTSDDLYALMTRVYIIKGATAKAIVTEVEEVT